jgi:hypothetical protein
MKYLFLLLFAVLPLRASTALYTWTPAPQPPLRPGFHRVVASGSFTVDMAVVTTGLIKAADVHNLLFRVSSPANYFYRTFDDGGSFEVDPLTGVIIDGAMHAIDPVSTYGRSMYFFPTLCFCQNVNGGAYRGAWTVTIYP